MDFQRSDQMTHDKLRWLPAISMMSIIFLFSARPAHDLPDFGSLDYFIKKTGHVLSYAALAVCYQYALNKRSSAAAWVLSILFAATDEFHQSFVPGRHPSRFDVIFFDDLGALLGLWLYARRKSSAVT